VILKIVPKAAYDMYILRLFPASNEGWTMKEMTNEQLQERGIMIRISVSIFKTERQFKEFESTHTKRND
jgi:hypothetical protein